MKALIISDSHGNAEAVINAIDETEPNGVFFLGDGLNDLRGLGLLYPTLEVYSVSGNCDYMSFEEPERCISFGGLMIYMTHGHIYRVKQGLGALIRTAKNYGADIALYGHTHCPYYSDEDGITVINPGSLGRDGCYGVLTIENGTFDYEEFEL